MQEIKSLTQACDRSLPRNQAKRILQESSPKRNDRGHPYQPPDEFLHLVQARPIRPAHLVKHLGLSERDYGNQWRTALQGNPDETLSVLQDYPVIKQ